jgi:hypothetical protein
VRRCWGCSSCPRRRGAAAARASIRIAPSPGTAPWGTVAAGALRLPPAGAFGEPGFHQVLTASARVPSLPPGNSRATLLVSLRDLDRPRERCGSEHPLSGCATVDWADDPARPKVPADGVFENRLTVRLRSGTRTLFLRRSGDLAASPDPFSPG